MKKKIKCLVCKGEVLSFINFGKMPIANGFLLPEQFSQEYFFNLEAGFCKKCFLAQLTETVDPSKLFHKNYPFYSSTSEGMKKHFYKYARNIKSKYLKYSRDPFVIEIGSNDGIMLKYFKEWNIRHLGVEPSKNVADEAIKAGINTVTKFFTPALASEILKKYGKSDVVYAANVICHIPDLNSLLLAVKKLLKPKGVFIFEEPYIGDILKKTSYDQIYDEHVYFFSANSVRNIAKKHGLELVDVSHQSVHGGELRYTLALKNAYKSSPKLLKVLQEEKHKGLLNIKPYINFKRKVDINKEKLIFMLKKIKAEGKRVVGYAATSKSTTVINYFGITPDLIEYISDTTPMKQGKFSPGVHIPIKSHDVFAKRYPHYALLFGWNHAKEIIAKEQDFARAGGKWLVYVPSVKVLK